MHRRRHCRSTRYSESSPWPKAERRVVRLAACCLCGLLLASAVVRAAETADMLTVGMGTGRPATIDAALVAKLAETMAAEQPNANRFEAGVWLAASEQRLSRYLDDRDERLVLLRTVYRESHRQGLDPDLVLAVMTIESRFDRYAISRVGAQGLMQVMPFWRLEIGRPQDNLTEMETNVRYGTTILAYYLDMAGNDLVDALGRYNGSRGRFDYPEKVMTVWRRVWRNKAATELPRYQWTCARYALSACLYN